LVFARRGLTAGIENLCVVSSLQRRFLIHLLADKFACQFVMSYTQFYFHCHQVINARAAVGKKERNVYSSSNGP
jgi:hypothetical protein